MAWELKKVEDQRKILVNDYLQGMYTIKELCARFGVSRKTAHKWLNRYQLNGEKGLKDQSRARRTPSNIYTNELIEIALNLKYKYPSWGPRKILAKLESEYPRIEWPSATRLYEIFKKESLICPRRIRNRVPATQPLGILNNSNDIWIADFKGWFLTGDKRKCEPLTITDAFSRYLIKCEHLERKTANDVWIIFKEAFEEHGLPHRVRTDNGPPFGSKGAGRLTRLSVNLIKAGVIPEWINLSVTLITFSYKNSLVCGQEHYKNFIL